MVRSQLRKKRCETGGREVGDTRRRSKGKTTTSVVFAKKRLLPANSSSPSRRVPLEIRPRPASLRRSFMGRILVKNRFHGGKNDTAGGGGEGHPETLGVAVNGTVSNGIFELGEVDGARIYFDHVPLPSDAEDAVYALDHR